MAKILVVGGAGGLGSAVLTALVARADDVTVTVLNEDESERVRRRHGGGVAIHLVDLGDADAARNALQGIARDLGALDGVVVCAAVAPDNCPVELTPLASFREAFEINALGNVAVFQATMPALRAGQGRMVMISSTMGRVAMPAMGAYATSKHALEGVTDVMRREAAAQGVGIFLVVPGTIRTPMLTDKLAKMQQLHDAMGSEDRQRYGHLMLRLKEIATTGNEATAQTAEEVAEVVLATLDGKHPQARVLVGTAAQFYAMAGSMSDAALDEALAEMFSDPAAR